MIGRLRHDYQLKSRFERLRAKGLLTRDEMAKALGVTFSTVKAWRNKGWLRAVAYNDKNDYLYEPPGRDAPKKFKWKKGRYQKPVTQRTKGMQCEA
jgi:transcriptional regulator with XRE-family HTH domain